ncbi:MAG: tryptophan synthase subunit alpha [Phycisphaerales bacterium]
MGRIDDIFTSLKADGRTALMPFIAAGHPDLAVTEAVLPRLQAAGASIVELGIPFSDPIADGPVIASAMHEALAAGVRPADVLELVRRVRGSLDLGIVAMVSCSIVDRLGGPAFIDEAVDAGFDGFIVPDADLDAAERLFAAAAARDVALAMLIAPTTTDARRERLVGLSRGFTYLLARAGITGERAEAPDIGPGVAGIRRLAPDLPIACGFGISQPEHVAAVTQKADAAIVGSALVRTMGDAADPVAAAERMTASLAAALHRR